MDRPLRTTLEEMIEAHVSRRAAVKGILAAGGAMTATWCLPQDTRGDVPGHGQSLPVETAGAGFQELPHVPVTGNVDEVASIGVADGYNTQVLIRWGDPVLPGAKPMDLLSPDSAAQENQFGYNNDFIAYLPFRRGERDSQHGILCVNHEFTNPELMFTGITYDDKLESRSDEQIRIEKAAHGHSVMEIRQDKNQVWHVVQDSPLNRRFTLNTEFVLSGPAAGHRRLQTEQDPSGKKVIGTISNCSGGVTPWGTVLSGEENIQYYFHGDIGDSSEAANHQRMGIDGTGDYSFFRLDKRFDLAATPNEPNRFGWVVEIDPYDPHRPAVKRTALGRFRHEGAATAINRDGRVVVYSGDDERFEYLYKFVSQKKYDPERREKNRDLLDEGILYVARFDGDGSVNWLPLIYGTGPLTWKNGFHSQADVLIDTRRAADLMGATPMDRPEDVEENPVTHHVFVVLSKNYERTEEQVDSANPRAINQHGHIIELEIPQVEGEPDHAATIHPWSMFLKAGQLEQDDAWYDGQKPTTWLSCPDNITFDNQGRLWIATDGFQKSSGVLDGIYACEVAGPKRALTKQFFHVPTGAELCGPCFTPDNSTLFVGVQHPGEYSTFDEPSTRWPNDATSDLPPQPSVVAITRRGGGPING
ncbi:MAG: PhoX family phosphatase [Planctomycetota bacterium]|nr:PhoX family phosphatase [Planctomycetota bacterium]